jgi:hypothetical protein
MRKEMTALSKRLVSLKDREAETLHPLRPLKLQVIEGAAYVTLEGDATDYIVRPGEAMCIVDSGRAVIQGLPNVRYRVSA